MRRRGSGRARGDPLVHLIDAHAYVFRAYHALPPIEAPDGAPTGAAYGYAGTLLKYLAEREPTHLAVAFDFALTSFRNEIEPGYKQGRSEPPADLAPQLGICAEVTRALGLRLFSREGYEADDVIATLAQRLLARRARVRVVSPDKDLAQIVTRDGRVEVFDLAREARLDAEGVREKFGVDPEQIPDYLGLVGDGVDNLPGVPGVGRKSAAAALAAFGTIERIPADPAQWEGAGARGAARLAERIDAHRERALRTRELARVRRDVPGLRFSLSELAYRGPDRERSAALCARLGWKRLAERIAGGSSPGGAWGRR